MAIAPTPHPVAYCGVPADTSVIERTAAAKDGVDRTAIMSILVVDGYARVLVEGRGEDILYFVKHDGHWYIHGRQAPANLPAIVAHRFATVQQSTTVCGNPHFVNHPSGP